MTIEKLLKLSATQLEGMSDAELMKELSHYFDITRPTVQMVAQGKVKKKNKTAQKDYQEAQQMLKSLGITLPKR